MKKVNEQIPEIVNLDPFRMPLQKVALAIKF